MLQMRAWTLGGVEWGAEPGMGPLLTVSFQPVLATVPPQASVYPSVKWGARCPSAPSFPGTGESCRGVTGAPRAAVRGTHQIPVTSAKTAGQMENLGRACPGLVAPSCSLAPVLSSHLAPPPPSAWLLSSLACLTSGHYLSLLHPFPGCCAVLPLGASCAHPSPLLSFVEAAPLGHEARGGAAAVGGRELHAG